MRPNQLLAGAVFCGTGVLLGAWGAHGLADFLQSNNLPLRTDTWDTAVLYQLVHGVALLVIGLWQTQSPRPIKTAAGYLLITGSVFFCGSLYFLTLGGPGWLGPITPVGGSLLIIGWGCVIWAAMSEPQRR